MNKIGYSYYERRIKLHELEKQCSENRAKMLDIYHSLWYDYLKEVRDNGENYIKGEHGRFAGSKPGNGGGNSSAKSVDKSQNGGIMESGSDNVNLTAEKETEYGVKYAEDSINADMEYINSDKFAEKFRDITPNEKVNQALLECSREAIEHHNGTLYEDMYLINGFTGEIMGKQTEAKVIQKINYNDSLNNAIKKAKAENIPLIALHTHPEDYPPSIDDFNSLYIHGYALGVVAGHNGQVYTFRGLNKIIENTEDIQCDIAFAYKGGVDVDRAHRDVYDVYKVYGIGYDIKGGKYYEKKR